LIVLLFLFWEGSDAECSTSGEARAITRVEDLLVHFKKARAAGPRRLVCCRCPEEEEKEEEEEEEPHHHHHHHHTKAMLLLRGLVCA